MSINGVTYLMLILAVVGAMAVSFSTLVWLGFRAGDRHDDARARVTLHWAARPDGWELQAVVAVNNPAASAAMVSARANPVPVLALALREPRSVHVPFRERRHLLETTTLLGAADQAGLALWTLPLAVSAAVEAVRMDLRIDQHRRARLIRYLLPVPSAPTGMIETIGARGPRGA